ncbi:MAG: tryptophan 2,3-dioxygenase family protein [Bacteroidota bacterium]
MAEKDWKHQLTHILDRLSLLEEKYAGMGQDMLSYLDGLYYSNGLTYWDYIHLDSLLGLQQPRTPFKDETIFIVYHQISELMFKLVKQELTILTSGKLEPKEGEIFPVQEWCMRLDRVCNYFKHLCNSFDIMLTGMDKDEMRKFRMALLPASGFQSVQFRHIEIMSTSVDNLIGEEAPTDEHLGIEELYPRLYWKRGGIDLDTKEKTITLRAFEKRYDEPLIQMLQKFETRNLNYLLGQAPKEIRELPELRDRMRSFDQYVNLFWKLSHLSAASKHLVSGNQEVEEATGGTNWRTFLPPKFQRIIFFPGLWTAEEKKEWGKAGVIKYFQAEIAKQWMK